MAKLIIFPSQPPLVIVPYETKVHILDLQPQPRMIVNDEHEVEVNLLKDVAQVFFSMNRCLGFYNFLFFIFHITRILTTK